jgi:hypothetical protein
MRLDGFAAMTAGDQEGTLLTKPFVLAGDRLFVNAVCDAAKGGSIRVELLDEAGKPLSGSSSQLCTPVTGDGIALPIAWREGGGLGQFQGRVVRLKFVMQNASLYSFVVQQASEAQSG